MNKIIDVSDKGVTRESENSRSGRPSLIRANEFKRVWRSLTTNGALHTKGWTVFSFALLQAAMADYVNDVGGGWIALRGHVPPWNEEDDIPGSYKASASLDRIFEGEGWGAAAEIRGESEIHWKLKHYIHAQPNRALSELAGAEFSRSALERPLPTHDRIDVVVRDRDARWVLIEVKPRVRESDRRWYAQVAKYRTICHVLDDHTRLDDLRCVLVAPIIEPNLAKKMKADYDIESLEVTVPADFRPPPR